MRSTRLISCATVKICLYFENIELKQRKCLTWSFKTKLQNKCNEIKILIPLFQRYFSLYDCIFSYMQIMIFHNFVDEQLWHRHIASGGGESWRKRKWTGKGRLPNPAGRFRTFHLLHPKCQKIWDRGKEAVCEWAPSLTSLGDRTAMAQTRRVTGRRLRRARGWRTGSPHGAVDQVFGQTRVTPVLNSLAARASERVMH